MRIVMRTLIMKLTIKSMVTETLLRNLGPHFLLTYVHRYVSVAYM
jgi:hypothetical protein